MLVYSKAWGDDGRDTPNQVDSKSKPLAIKDPIIEKIQVVETCCFLGEGSLNFQVSQNGVIKTYKVFNQNN